MFPIMDQLEKLMSEKEDLEDQIAKQDVVMASIRMSLEKLKKQNKDYQNKIASFKREIKGKILVRLTPLQKKKISGLTLTTN